jgi:hypothetical protein
MLSFIPSEPKNDERDERSFIGGVFIELAASRLNI